MNTTIPPAPVRSFEQEAHRLTMAVALILFASFTSAYAGGFTPEEARQRMTVPDGFRAEVFASEPDIRQPVTACFDERGRMWVIEYLQYPVPAGLKPVTVDQYLRTEYDRFPEPPPKGPRGADRIKILEDTDGDGKADKVTTFVEGLNLASGLAVGHGGVFVGQAPYLLFYPDRDKDDKPDGDPEVLLTGFGLQDAHATVNSMMWGPDGWLYGAQGSTVTARIRGIEFQQGIWRYEPRSKRFELFAEGGGNTWGVDFDRQGNAFGSSNSSFVTFHMVQGGYYWKGFAKHGPLHNPNTFGYFDSVEYHGRKPGGHVTPGGIIYKGDNFPDEFRGAFIGGNLLANTVYWYKLSPRGSTFSARLGGTLIDSHDPWFRPIDLFTGPDGSVFVVDWYDKRASHLDPRDNWDKTNGRIYKISYRETKKLDRFDLTKKSSEELVALRSQANDWWPDMARRVLAERRDPAVVPKLRRFVSDDRDPDLALRDLWALDVSGGLDESTARSLLDHTLPGVRRWVIRRLGDEGTMSDSLLSRLLTLATDEPDSLVRSQLASSCQRWESSTSLAILARLLARSEDATDPHIPLLLWWAVERQLRPDREGVLALLSSPDVQRLPLARDFLLERTVRALCSSGIDDDLKACGRLLDSAAGDAQLDRIIAGMDKGLEGRRFATVPEAFAKPLRRVVERPGIVPLRLASRLGSREAQMRALAMAEDAKTAEADRIALIDGIGQVTNAQSLATLYSIWRRGESPAVENAVLSALGRYPTPDVASVLLERYPRLSEPMRDRVRDLLCSRKDWASSLIDAMSAGKVPTKDLRPVQVLQIVQLGDTALVARVESVWGRVPGPNSEAKKQRIAEIRGMLPEGDKGSASRGKTIFQKNCATCHKLFGEGDQIGPDLTGAERGNLEFLLTSVVDPSAVIRKEYQAQTVAMKDGRVLTGLVVEESANAITLVDSKPQKTTLGRADIEETKASATSLMPEGLLDKLPENEVRDLFRYLQSSGPPR